MTPNQFRRAIADLGLSQGEAARLFEVSLRTSHGWARGDAPVPRAVALVLLALQERSHRGLVAALDRVRAA